MISMEVMSMFNDMLKDSESLFLDDVPLNYDFLPKNITARESEQNKIKACIKPLVLKRNGKNLLLHGPPGIGKTVVVRHMFKILEEETDDILPIYINT